MPSHLGGILAITLILAFPLQRVLADPNDWVNPSYVVKAPLDRSAHTSDAQNSIVSGAGSTARNGPWSVTNSKGVLPPSQDPHDYLSWAPYHWPDCNWCGGKGTNHLVNPGDNNGDSDSDAPPASDTPPDNSDPYADGGDMDEYNAGVESAYDAWLAGNSTDAGAGSTNSTDYAPGRRMVRKVRRSPEMIQLFMHHRTDSEMTYSTATESGSATPSSISEAEETIDNSGWSSMASRTLAGSPTYTWSGDFSTGAPENNDMSTSTSTSTWDATSASASAADIPGDLLPPAPLPTAVLPSGNGILPTSASTPQTTDGVLHGTPAPAQAPVHTHPAKPPCKPSPTRSLAPSATWMTCAYVGRDGQVNPDVRTLNGPEAINSASQSILYNAIASVVKQSSTYSKTAVSFIDTFFLNDATRMNPNMNFGQMVRGPGKSGQEGTFTGVLDLRGIVKIINGILVLKASNSSDWTSARDSAMASWMAQYAEWLQKSDPGMESASRPNNHATFYISQLVATRVLAGDTAGATDALQQYFSHQFLDQIAASGEQPFEAVRTRPYHYRCFNLEAMIVNAKIGDQLGLNLWAAKSKYGATIQTALDYTMALNPKGEHQVEIVPHVASIAAAYGDPKGKYAAFMKKTLSDYQSKSFWFYDQTVALASSPAARHMSTRQYAYDEDESAISDDTPTSPVPFSCPTVFDLDQEVEIDNSVFVTCDELKPFYEIPVLDV